MATKTVQLMLVTTVKGQQVLTPVAVQLKGIASAAQAAQPPIQNLQNKLNSFGNVVSKSISNVRGTIVGLGTAMAIIGSIQMFASVIREADEFNTKLAQVNSILDSSTVSIDHLKQGILSLGGELGTASELAQSMYDVLSGGVDAAKALEVVEHAATFAKGSIAEMRDSTQLLITVMNAYGDKAGSLAHITDVLTFAVKEGVGGGQQFASALGTVINTASIAGVKFEEVATALATLTRVGLSWDEAATALNQAMLAFIDPASQSAKAAEKLGIDLSAAALQTKGLVGAMFEMQEKAEGNIEVFAELFNNVRALKGTLGLTGEQMHKFAADAKEAETGVDGLAQKVLNLSTQSFSEQRRIAITNFTKAINSFSEEILDVSTETLVSGLNAITEVIVTKNLPDWVYKLAAALGTLAVALVAVKVTSLSFQLGDLLLLLPRLNAAITGLKIAAFTQSFTSLSAVINSAVLTFGALGTAALITGAAIVGWNIGRMISDIDRLSDILVVVIPPLGIFVKWLERLEAIDVQGKFTSLGKRIEDSFTKDFGDRFAKVAENASNVESAVQALFLTLAGQGIVIQQGNKTLDEWRTQLINAATQLRTNRKELEAGTSKLLKFNETVNVTGKGVSELDKELQKLAESFRDIINPSDALAKKINDLQRAGFTETEIIKGLSKEIVDVAQKEEELNGILHKQVAIRLERAKAIEENIKWLKMELPAAKELFEVSKFGEVEEFLPFGKTSLAEQAEEFEDFVADIDRMREDWADREEQLLKTIEDYWKTHWANLMIGQTDFATNFVTVWQATGSKLQGIMAGIGVTLGTLAGQMDGTFAAILSAASAFSLQFQKAMEAGLSKLQSLAIGGAAFLNTLVDSLSKSKESKIGGAIGSVVGGLAGSILGPLGTIIGSALGKAVGAFIGSLFAHDWSKDVKKFASSIGLAVSEELTKQIAARAEEIGDAMTATFLSLDLIADEMKITAANVDTFITDFQHAFNTLGGNIEYVTELTEDLNKVFPDMLAAATDAFGYLSPAMLQFIAYLKEAGIEVEALTEFMKGQFASAAQSIDNLITKFVDGLDERLKDFDLDNLTKFDKLKLNEIRAEFDDFFSLVFAQINRMQAEGYSLAEIFDVLGPSIEKLRDAAIDLGLRGTPAFAALNQLFKVMRSEAVQTLGDVNNLLVTFHNTGILTQKTFSSLEDIFSKVYKEFNKDGKISRVEMQAMLPTLAQLRFLSEKYGFTLDKTTQKLIQQAIEQGKLSDEIPIDPMDRLADVIDTRLVPALDTLNATLSSTLGLVNSIDGSTIDITTNYSTTGTPPSLISPKPYTGGTGFTILSGQGVHEPMATVVKKREQLFLAHQNEKVTIEPFGNSATAVSTTEQKQTHPPIRLEIPIIRQDLNGREIVDELITVSINNGTPLVTSNKGRRG